MSGAFNGPHPARTPIVVKVFTRDDLAALHLVLAHRISGIQSGIESQEEPSQRLLSKAVEITKLQLKIEAALSAPEAGK